MINGVGNSTAAYAAYKQPQDLQASQRQAGPAGGEATEGVQEPRAAERAIESSEGSSQTGLGNLVDLKA